MKSFFEFCQLLKKEQVAPAGVMPGTAPATPAKPVDPSKLIPGTFVKDLQATAKKSGNRNVEAEVKNFIKSMEQKGFQTIDAVKPQ